jgi:virulence-associated protein VapD
LIIRKQDRLKPAMADHYDFTNGERGKYAKRYSEALKEGTMATATITGTRPHPIQTGLPPVFKRAETVYAIAFDMDIEQLRIHYGDPYNNAYLEIRRVLEGHQFQWQQGSVYFGGPEVTAATVMVAVIDLTSRLPWFAASVRDIRMLRIEELNDLMPVVERIAGLQSGNE